jgi:hypothetical protein
MNEQDQDAILKKALKKLGLPYNRTFFIAVITGTIHPENAVEIEHNNLVYYVTIKNGDFVCIFLN